MPVAVMDERQLCCSGVSHCSACLGEEVGGYPDGPVCLGEHGLEDALEEARGSLVCFGVGWEGDDAVVSGCEEVAELGVRGGALGDVDGQGGFLDRGAAEGEEG
jgi:hypothetical protein